MPTLSKKSGLLISQAIIWGGVIIACALMFGDDSRGGPLTIILTFNAILSFILTSFALDDKSDQPVAADRRPNAAVVSKAES